MSYADNPLNIYDTYSYNVSVYIANPVDGALTPEGVVGRDNTIELINNHTLAKFRVIDMEQTFSVGYDRVRTGFANVFNMRVAETNGVTLLNDIKVASDALGLPNYHEALYVIKVEFIGRDNRGRSRKFTPAFYYSTKITKFDFKVDGGGTNYNIEFVEYSTTAYHYLTNVIKDQITITARTVGDFFDKFNTALEQSIDRIYLLNEASLYKDTVLFEFDETTDRWRQWEFQELTENYDTPGINIVGTEGNEELQITINNGSNLTEIFGIILQLTKEYKQVLRSSGLNIVNGTFFKDEGPEQSVQLNTLEEFPVLHKVIATVEPTAYDPLRNDYQKTVRYTCHAYVVTSEIVSADPYYRSIGDDSIQRRRFRNLQSNGLLRKRYDYIGTGENTEVLELDMQFDMAYFYLVPHGGGLTGDSDVVAPTAVNDPGDPITRLRDAKVEISRLARQASNRRSSLARAPSSDVAIGLSAIDQRLNTALDSFNSFRDETFDDIQEQFGFRPGGINHPLTFATDAVDPQNMSRSDDDREGGNMRFGALRANVESASDFLIIEIGIRGDPYWMGFPNSDINLNNGRTELAQYDQGTLNFFLNANLPVSDEDGQGRRKPSPDYQLSGIYSVLNVINRFSNGQFTQYLKARRDMASNTNSQYDIAVNEGVQDAGQISEQRDGTAPDRAQQQEDALRRLGGPF